MKHTSRIALAAILSLALSGGLVACQKAEEKKAETPTEHAAPPADTAKPAPPAPAGPAKHEIVPPAPAPAPAPAPEPAPAEKSMLDTVKEKTEAAGEAVEKKTEAAGKAVMEGAEKAGEAVEKKTESAIDAAKGMLPGQEHAATPAPEVAPAPVPAGHPAVDAVKDAAQPVKKKLEGC